MKISSLLLRLILSGILIYFVYLETGAATTIFAILAAINFEVQNLSWQRIGKGIWGGFKL